MRLRDLPNITVRKREDADKWVRMRVSERGLELDQILDGTKLITAEGRICPGRARARIRAEARGDRGSGAR